MERIERTLVCDCCGAETIDTSVRADAWVKLRLYGIIPMAGPAARVVRADTEGHTCPACMDALGQVWDQRRKLNAAVTVTPTTKGAPHA